MFTIIAFCCLFLLVNTIYSEYGYKRRRNIAVQCILCFLLLFIFFGFRSLSVLNDTSHYYKSQLYLTSDISIKNSILDIDNTSRFEPGFQVLQKFIGKYISVDPYALIMVSALLLSIGTILFLKKNTTHIAICVFFLLTLGILIEQYSAMRQSYAVLLFYFACNYYEKRRYISSIILIYLATLFHSSAIVLIIPFILDYFFQFSKKNVMCFTILGIGTISALYPILNSLNFGDSLYISQSITRQSIALAAILSSILLSVILITCYYLNNKYNLIPPPKLWLWISIIGILLSFGAIKIQVFARFALYFTPFIILTFIHYLYQLPTPNRNRLLFICILIFLLRTAIILEYRNEWNHLIPYNFYDFGAIYHEYEFGY